MSSSKIPITVAPSPIVLPPKYITSFDYTITDFEAYTKIVFLCNLFDSDNNLLDTRTIEIAGCEYYNWGYDDSYLINIISQKLGLSTFPPIKKPVSDCFKIGYDLSGNIIKFKNLTIDLSGNIILPSGFTRDPNNMIIDNFNVCLYVCLCILNSFLYPIILVLFTNIPVSFIIMYFNY